MSTHGALTITAFKWVPPFAQGQVRDHRLRWLLKEIDWDYSVELIDPAVQQSAAYRAEQPFGQVPVLREDGRHTLFETGAIVLDIAERSGKLLPADEGDRALAKCWLFAALNSVEPYLTQIALADVFIRTRTSPRVTAPSPSRWPKSSSPALPRRWATANGWRAATSRSPI